MKERICIGVFSSVVHADQAIAALKAADFRQDDISVICPHHVHPHDRDVHEQDGGPSRTVEPALAGGSIGALLGAVAGGVGVVATGGIGLLVAGPLLGAAAAAGAISGGFIGAMAARGFEPDLADFYDQALQRGKILVAIEADDPERLKRAKRVFERAGAEPLQLPSV
jgi:hypothetical protein